MSITENKIVNSDYHILSKYIDFPFDPYIDFKRIEILNNIMTKLSYRNRNKYALDIINSLSDLDRKDPILPNNIYEMNKNKLLNSSNKKIYIKTFKKNGKIYFTFKNKKFELQIKNYNRIKNKFEGNQNIFHLIIFTLLNRYNLLNLLNSSSGSVNPKSYKQLENNYNVSIEGFSSFYNNNLRYYCGLFPDLEKYFGCIGNIFNTQFIKGIVVFNPPFYVDFMNKFFKYILNHSATKIFILPAFKISDRKKLNKICKIQKEVDYEDDYEIQTIRDNDNIYLDYLFCKENFTYYDFLMDKHIKFTMTNIIVTNAKTKIDIDEIFGKPDIILHKPES
jgi:hypothetical protein